MMTQRVECKHCTEEWPVFTDHPEWTAEMVKDHAVTYHPDFPWWSTTNEEF